MKEAVVSAWKECPTCDAVFALQSALNQHLAACPGSEDKQRIAELEDALRGLVADCDDYARINNLSGTWATIEQARKVLG